MTVVKSNLNNYSAVLSVFRASVSTVYSNIIILLCVLFQGYFRRAEVEAASGLYDEAVISYTRALQLDPQNTKLMESIKNLTDMQRKKIKGEENL